MACEIAERADLIPDGTKVRAKVTGCERVYVGKNGDPRWLYRVRVVVTEGPHAGRTADRTVWHTEGGFRQLAADMVELGHCHPEELCRGLWREYPITAGITIGTNDVRPVNEVKWFRSAVPVRKPEPLTSATAAEDHDDRFAAAF